MFIHLIGRVPEESERCNLILIDISERILAENALNANLKHAIDLEQAHLRLIDYAVDHDVQALLQKFIDEAEILTRSEIGFYHFVENNQETITLQAWSTNTRSGICKVPDLDHCRYPVSQAGIWVECIRELKPVIHNDYNNATGKKELPEGHVPLVRDLVVPVIRNNKVLAILGVGNKNTNYDQSDVKAVQRLANVAWEIVERKRAEEALIKSENHARALIDAIPDMMFRIDKHGIFLDFEAATDQLYYKDGTIIGKNCLEILPPELAAQTLEKISLTLETGEMQVYEYQLTISGKSASDFEARMVAASSNEVVTIVRDISAERKNARALFIMNQKLKNANAEKDKFFSIIAHDLKSPFNVFLGATELIAKEFDVLSNEQIQSLIGSLHGSAKKLYELLENLLEWSRMQRGVFPYEPGTIPLLDFISEALGLIIEMAGNKNIDFKINIPADIVIYADAKMFNSLIRNLADNAVKFTNPGGRIIIAAQKISNNLIEISISDNGIGMPPETIDKLFSLTENNSRPGTQGEPSVGLGLLLCNEFAKRHGSELYVESEEGKGSKFSFKVSENG